MGTRRDFLQASAAVAGALVARHPSATPRDGADIKVGLFGCGRRGTLMAQRALRTQTSARLVAVADVFDDQSEAATQALLGQVAIEKQVSVDPLSRFAGLDAGQQLIQNADLDVVLLCGPPYFTPHLLKLAVDKGLHAYVEGPAAVDATGLRDFKDTIDAARDKVAIMTNLHWRRDKICGDAVRAVRDGRIGAVTGIHLTGHQGNQARPRFESGKDVTTLAYQMRNWPYFAWLSGDFILQSHTPRIDVMSWVIGSVPDMCSGIGGRQARTRPEFGNVYDHFDVNWYWSTPHEPSWKIPEGYPHGLPAGPRANGSFREWPQVQNNREVYIVGTKGLCHPWVGFIVGEDPKDFRPTESTDRKGQPFEALFEACRGGPLVNEGDWLHRATLTAMMGRMAAYSGETVKRDFVVQDSDWKLGPEGVAPAELATLDLAHSVPAENQARPGTTKLR